MQRVVFDGPNRVRDISSARTFRGTLRRVLDVVHRRCNHPTCFVPAHRCQGDHIVPWSHGGTTTQGNGRLGCGTHNRWWYSHEQGTDPPQGGGPPGPPSGPTVGRRARSCTTRAVSPDLVVTDGVGRTEIRLEPPPRSATDC
jgi:HNH endonuclease